MATVIAIVDGLSRTLFFIACALVAAMVFVVSYDVGTRNLGLPPPVWAVNSVEYAMLHITFLSLPELVRTRGHVCVELLLVALGSNARRYLEKALHIAAALICFYLAWRSGIELLKTIESGAYEVRSFDMPMWALFISMPFGFLLGGLEFLAFPLRSESFFSGPAEAMGGL
jgi:TRAP-type C4-dicarboxylate transport system permease small subunit